jgi:hypothetical protein
MLSGELLKPSIIIFRVLNRFIILGITGNLCVLLRPLEHEEAFDILYCIAFEMMDAQWLAMRASYMQFNVN